MFGQMARLDHEISPSAGVFFELVRRVCFTMGAGSRTLQNGQSDDTEGPWTVGYVCRPLDARSPHRATQILWIRALAAEPRVRHVHVLTPRVGDVDLPENVTVHQFRRGRGTHLLRTALSFYRSALSIPESVDFYVVVQGGPYPALLLPIRLATRTPVYQWKAHPVVSKRMQFYARYCDDLVFTATPQSLPLDLPNRRIIGHGIDTDVFKSNGNTPRRGIVVLGRISPIKHIEQAIDLMAEAARQGHDWTLDIVGPIASGRDSYVDMLKEKAQVLGVAGQVRFQETISHTDVPDLLTHYQAMLSFSQTAFDKVVGEAMACRLPVMTTNPAVLEDLPIDLLEYCSLPQTTSGQVRHVARILALEIEQREELGERLRRYVEERHSLDAFFGKMLDAVEACDHGRWVRPIRAGVPS